ncbi:MAG: methyltransferase family protein [Candidatus Thorarchaeota archaeon]
MEIVGPIVSCLAFADVFLHLYLDFVKDQIDKHITTSNSNSQIPQNALLISALTTIIAFILVAIFSFSWLLRIELSGFLTVFLLVDTPLLLWVTGLAILSVGILLHGWSRLVRGNYAANWELSNEQPLVTTGPYSRIRHPSYSSYFLSFIGLFLLIPSLPTLFLFSGYWGYNEIAKQEEKMLVSHFGEAYSKYMGGTGRFLPKF